MIVLKEKEIKSDGKVLKRSLMWNIKHDNIYVDKQTKELCQVYEFSPWDNPNKPTKDVLLKIWKQNPQWFNEYVLPVYDFLLGTGNKIAFKFNPKTTALNNSYIMNYIQRYWLQANAAQITDISKKLAEFLTSSIVINKPKDSYTLFPAYADNEFMECKPLFISVNAQSELKIDIDLDDMMFYPVGAGLFANLYQILLTFYLHDGSALVNSNPIIQDNITNFIKTSIMHYFALLPSDLKPKAATHLKEAWSKKQHDYYLGNASTVGKNTQEHEQFVTMLTNLINETLEVSINHSNKHNTNKM